MIVLRSSRISSRKQRCTDVAAVTRDISFDGKMEQKGLEMFSLSQ